MRLCQLTHYSSSGTGVPSLKSSWLIGPDQIFEDNATYRHCPPISPDPRATILPLLLRSHSKLWDLSPTAGFPELDPRFLWASLSIELSAMMEKSYICTIQYSSP